MKTQELLDLLADLAAKGDLAGNVMTIIDRRLNYAEEMRQALVALQPGATPVKDLQIRSVQFSLRDKDRQTFVAVRATKRPGTEKEELVVGFHSAKAADQALYEMKKRIERKKVKWREDVPFEANAKEEVKEKTLEF